MLLVGLKNFLAEMVDYNFQGLKTVRRKKNQQNFFLFFFCVGLCHNNKKAVTYQSKLLISTVKTANN